jgi:hypothetical protein
MVAEGRLLKATTEEMVVEELSDWPPYYCYCNPNPRAGFSSIEVRLPWAGAYGI